MDDAAGVADLGLDSGALSRRRRRERDESRAQIDCLSARAVLLFAAFASWWVAAIVLIPWLQDRLGVEQVVFAAIGLPIVVASWVVAARMRGAVRCEVPGRR